MLTPLLTLLALQTPQPMRISPEGVRAVDPQVAVSQGKAAVAYGVGNTIFVDEVGKTTHIDVPGQLALGMRRGPRIAFSRGALVVTAISGSQGKGKDGELYAWRLGTGETKWAGPYRVTDTDGAAREGLHGLAVSTTGRLASVWLDLRNKGTQVWTSTSDDGGKTWSKNFCAYRSPDGHVCECCHPSAAFGTDGKLYVMFRNWLGGARDMYLTSSADGTSFGPAQKLGEGTWPLNACPMDGGSLYADKTGAVETAWRRENAVFTCRPGKAESNVGAGVQIWTSSSGWSVWQSGSDIMARHDSEPARTLAHDGSRPSVSSDGTTTVAAWSDSNGVAWTIKLQ